MALNKTQKRHQVILGIVAGGDVNVDELSLHFGVSESTIRRDLAELVNSGRIVRTYGGAVLSHDARRESSLDERNHLRRAQKKAIARLAALQIREGETIILDAGTTTGALARQLGGRSLHLITNNIAALAALSNEPNITLTVLGGSLRRMSMGTVGPLTESMLSRITADKVFLGADGLVAGRGLCEASQEQAALKEKMIAQASEVFVLVDASKVGFAGQQAWTPLDRRWTLITDSGATPAQLAPFQEQPNITVMVAELGGSHLEQVGNLRL
jgi:DeoR family fructose operon transcriptional repressor